MNFVNKFGFSLMSKDNSTLATIGRCLWKQGGPWVYMKEQGSKLVGTRTSLLGQAAIMLRRKRQHSSPCYCFIVVRIHTNSTFGYSNRTIICTLCIANPRAWASHKYSLTMYNSQVLRCLVPCTYFFIDVIPSSCIEHQTLIPFKHIINTLF